jgi:hypothetical protein
MNTANLQLGGLLLALSALIDELKVKGVLSEAEIDAALARAEAAALADQGRPAEVSAANVDAVCFPIRFLRHAARHAPEARSFTAVASGVGRMKPQAERVS